MLTLHPLRHAKSIGKDPARPDFGHPLHGRGQVAAPPVGPFMSKKKIRPDMILSCTAELAAELCFDERIYKADAARLLDVVSHTEEPFGSALLVGHNPGMEDLLETMMGEKQGMPTGALGRIILDVERRSKVRGGAGRLDWLARAKELVNT